MGCGCKNKKSNGNVSGNQTETLSKKMLIIHYSLKVFGFLVFIVLLPIINIGILVITFKMLVLSEDIDLKPMIKSIYDKLKYKTKKDDDDDDDELVEDDFELMEVEDITEKINNA